MHVFAFLPVQFQTKDTHSGIFFLFVRLCSHDLFARKTTVGGRSQLLQLYTVQLQFISISIDLGGKGDLSTVQLSWDVYFFRAILASRHFQFVPYTYFAYSKLYSAKKLCISNKERVMANREKWVEDTRRGIFICNTQRLVFWHLFGMNLSIENSAFIQDARHRD